MDNETKRCLREVIEYMVDEERRHWEESGRPRTHIFNCLKVVERWLIEHE